MESHPTRPSDSERRLERPDPSDRFYLEKLIDYYNKRRSFIKLGEHGVVVRDIYWQFKALYRNGNLKERALVAYLAFFWRDREAIDDFLRYLFPSSWPTIPEEDWPDSKTPSRVGLREALFRELKRAYSRPPDEAHRDPLPWRGPAKKPKNYLGKVVWEEAMRKKNARDEELRLWGKLQQEPTLDLDTQNLDKGEDQPTSSYRLENGDQVRVLRELTQDRNPMTRALAEAALELMPKGAEAKDIVEATGAEWWEYQEFQRKAKRLKEKFRENPSKNP